MLVGTFDLSPKRCSLTARRYSEQRLSRQDADFFLCNCHGDQDKRRYSIELDLCMVHGNIAIESKTGSHLGSGSRATFKRT